MKDDKLYWGICIVNTTKYKVEEVNYGDPKLLIGSKAYWGICNKESKNIYIDGSISLNERKKTLAHELTHAYLFETQLNRKDMFNEEEFCAFVELYAEQIWKLTNEFFKKPKKDKPQ